MYQLVTVEPNKEYSWRFWYKAEKANNVLVGVRDEDGNYLMPSTITTQGDYLVSANITFAEKRSASTNGNWHQGLLATEWQEYVITFNSLDQTAVWLTLNMFTETRIGWTDDWSIEEYVPSEEPATKTEVVNGGFENDLEGYKTSKLTSTVVTDVVHSGSKAVKVQGQGTSGQQCNLYQKITVEPNKVYKWKFWYKAEQANNVLVGVRDEDGNYLMPSTIITYGDYLSSATVSFPEKRDTSTANWHMGLLATGWQEYIITFNSLDQTAVWLTLNLFTETRSGWTDDWSIEEASTEINTAVTNGSFEEGLNSYYQTDSLVANVVTNVAHSGEKAVRLQGSDSYSTAHLYHPVEVMPNTYYKWTFWYKSEDGAANILAGVRTVNGTKLLPSHITTKGGNVNAENKIYSDLRGASTASTDWANWHQGFKTTEWREYSITFYSDEQQIVLLTLNMFYNNRIGYTDDWSISTDIDAALNNGGFESNLKGYEKTDTLTAEVATTEFHKGEQSAKLSVSGGTNTAYFYQAATVMPNTNYRWKFWYKSESGNNVLAGVRIADGTKLLPSKINTYGGSVDDSLKSFDALRDISDSKNWHQGMTTTDWKEYVITFNSGDQTSVLLTLNLYYNNRIGYTDDWSISEMWMVPGDINQDALVDVDDIGALRQELLKDDVGYLLDMDANADDSIDICDLVNIKKKLVVSVDGGSLDSKGYALVWEDNFSADYLDNDKWNLYPHMQAGDDLEIWDNEDAVKVKDGNVVLSSGKTTTQDVYYSPASLTTSGTMAFKYGYVEMRAKFPYGTPGSMAFWMKSTTTENSAMGEIDIFEQFPKYGNDTIKSALHIWGDEHLSMSAGQKDFGSKATAEEWHTYGLLWTEDELKFMVDGVVYKTIDLNQKNEFDVGDSIFSTTKSDMNAFKDYYYLIMNNYLLTREGRLGYMGDYAAWDDTYPIDYKIDYVRLYQRPDVDSIMFIN